MLVLLTYFWQNCIKHRPCDENSLPDTHSQFWERLVDVCIDGRLTASDDAELPALDPLDAVRLQRPDAEPGPVRRERHALVPALRDHDPRAGERWRRCHCLLSRGAASLWAGLAVRGRLVLASRSPVDTGASWLQQRSRQFHGNFHPQFSVESGIAQDLTRARAGSTGRAAEALHAGAAVQVPRPVGSGGRVGRVWRSQGKRG